MHSISLRQPQFHRNDKTGSMYDIINFAPRTLASHRSPRSRLAIVTTIVTAPSTPMFDYSFHPRHPIGLAPALLVLLELESLPSTLPHAVRLALRSHTHTAAVLRKRNLLAPTGSSQSHPALDPTMSYTTTAIAPEDPTFHPLLCLCLDLLLCPIIALADFYYTVIVYFRYYSPTTISLRSRLPLCSLVACSCRSAPVN